MHTEIQEGRSSYRDSIISPSPSPCNYKTLLEPSFVGYKIYSNSQSRFRTLHECRHQTKVPVPTATTTNFGFGLYIHYRFSMPRGIKLMRLRKRKTTECVHSRIIHAKIPYVACSISENGKRQQCYGRDFVYSRYYRWQMFSREGEGWQYLGL